MSAATLNPTNVSSKPVIVLLTACINPGAVIHVARREAGVRLGDYVRALTSWLRVKEIDGIVFCENSGADLTPLDNLVRSTTGAPRVELLSFSGQDFDPSLGKGLGEMRIIRYALANSNLLAPPSLVIKVTGRFFVRNIRSLLRGLRQNNDCDVFCDLRLNLTSSDSRVFCASQEFLADYLLAYEGVVNDSKGLFFENALAMAAHRAMADGMKWAPLPRAHRIVGVAGTNGRPVSHGLVNHLRRELLVSLKTAILKR